MPAAPVPTPSAPEVAGPYSAAVRAGDYVFLAGQLGIDPATNRLIDGGAVAQARRALVNVAAILADAGGSLTDVAKTTVFVTDLGDFSAVNAAYADAFGDHRPARSTFQVAALPLGGAVEIEAIAYLPEGSL